MHQNLRDYKEKKGSRVGKASNFIYCNIKVINISQIFFLSLTEVKDFKLSAKGQNNGVRGYHKILIRKNLNDSLVMF